MSFIKVLGESCFLFSDKKTKIITDPWFGESIYGGSWTQFPPPKVTLSDISNITHIFISHVHADHCSCKSLRKILEYSPKTKIIILDRKKSDCFLTKKLIANFGDSISERLLIYEAYKKYITGSFSTWCIPPEDVNSLNDLIDSSFLLETSKGLVFFGNDNEATMPHADFINSLQKKCFLALIAFSGGSGYPSSYSNISFADKLKIAKNIRKIYEKKSINFLNSTNFEFYMPIAGNHVITSKTYEWHSTTSFLLNPYSTILNANKFTESSKGIYFDPGDKIEINNTYLGDLNLNSLKKDFDFRKKLFVESFSSRIVIDAEIEKKRIPCTDWIEAYLKKIGSKLERLIKNLPNKEIYMEFENIFIINVKEKQLHIKFDGFNLKNFNKMHDNNMDKENTWLFVDIDPIVLYEISKRSLHINEADAGGLLNFTRNGPYYPDLYTIMFESF